MQKAELPHGTRYVNNADSDAVLVSYLLAHLLQLGVRMFDGVVAQIVADGCPLVLSWCETKENQAEVPRPQLARLYQSPRPQRKAHALDRQRVRQELARPQPPAAARAPAHLHGRGDFVRAAVARSLPPAATRDTRSGHLDPRPDAP